MLMGRVGEISLHERLDLGVWGRESDWLRRPLGGGYIQLYV